MTSSTWIRQAIGEDRIAQATAAAAAMRLRRTLGLPEAAEPDDSLRFAANALELQASALLEDEDSEALRRAAADAFQVARALSQPDDPLARGESLVRLACYGVLGDRGADVKRLLEREELSKLAQNEAPWGTRVQAAVLEIWLRLLRKRGWEDLDALQQRIVGLRADQGTFEPGYLKEAEKRQDSRPAWDLVGQYHLAKAAELLGTFLTQGSVDGHFDIREQLQAQCDRAISASARGQRLEQEALSRLLARTSRMLIDNSIWTVTRSVNSRVTRFVTSQASRDREQPLFEMLAPQRRVLREQGLLGSGRRAVVVSLPTSSGKTFIAQFRMLQALNQFDYEGGWIAYLAPTRALVNQVTRRLRQDFSPLGIHVEKVSPALEMDGIEASLLTEEDPEAQFRVLITTPEKLDLLLRSGWEGKIGRPLTLVVVDEAHGLADPERGLKLELLLATINRECHHAQFLLLTPFVPNAGEVARWLAPDSYEAMEIAAEWVPNDRVVALAKPRKGEGSGEFHIELVPLHTTHPTLDVPEPFVLESARHCGLRQSEVSRSPGKLAAATAQLLRKRGTVIVLVDKPSNSWGVAKALRVRENRISPCESVIPQLRAFFEDELGPNFPLYPLLEHGVAVHHAGLSEDVRALIEWLTERGEVKTLVATTTLAQGVNFPVSGVVFASHQYPFGNDMPAEDFWNIAGRAGRVDQGDIGIIALAANNLEREKRLERFVGRAVGELNSTLIEMVRRVAQTGELSRLELLIREPGWSAFLQYLAHNYRQIGDQDAFASQIEQVLRGTIGFQALRRSHPRWADALVQGVHRYGKRLQGQPLQLVDATGFSWESVKQTLASIRKHRITPDDWTPELFTSRDAQLPKMMGILIEVPELKAALDRAGRPGDTNQEWLADVLRDWVVGRPLTEIARDHFAGSVTRRDEAADGPPEVRALTRCCQSVFGALAQFASWGLAALQSLTLSEENALAGMSVEERHTLNNLPARAYYGVNSDAAVALRLLGVPRTAAPPLAATLGLVGSEPLHQVRGRLKTGGVPSWTSSLGDRGAAYYRVWTILNGDV